MSLKEAAARIKDRVNIVDFISEHLALKKVGRNYVGLCPFHAESKPSFTVSEEKQIFRCFGCGAGGDLIGFYMRLTGLSFPEAVKELAQRYGVPLQVSPEESSQDLHRKELYRINERAARFFQRLLETSEEAAKARDYLQERGLGKDTIRTFLLGYAPQEGGALTSHLRLAGVDLKLAEEAGVIIQREDGTFYDRFRGRLIFPIRDGAGRIVAFGGRVLGEGEPKYLNSPETPVYHKGRILYGFHEARTYIREADQGFVVEGYFDLLSLWEAGIRNVVASCGTALTKDHVKLLKRLTRQWFLVFDADSAGEKAAIRALELFWAEGVFPKVVFLPPGEDPDSLVRKSGAEAFWAEVHRAREGLTFLLGHLLKEHGSSPEGKSETVRTLRSFLAQIPDAVVKYEYQRLAADRLGLPEKLLLPSAAAEERKPPEDSEITGTPFERAILQFMVHHPHRVSDLKALGVEDFLVSPGYKELFGKILQALEEGQPIEGLILSSPEEQALFSDLLFSPPPEEAPERVLEEIRYTLLRERLRKERARILEAIREAETSGRKESLHRLLQRYRELCLQTNCRGEGAYEPFQE